jgi:hypothetical protein
MTPALLTPAEVLEEMLTVQQISTAWKLDERTIIRLFKGRSGVMELGTKRRTILRIPVSVAQAVKMERTARAS